MMREAGFSNGASDRGSIDGSRPMLGVPGSGPGWVDAAP